MPLLVSADGSRPLAAALQFMPNKTIVMAPTKQCHLGGLDPPQLLCFLGSGP